MPGWEAAAHASFPGGPGSALTKQVMVLTPGRLWGSQRRAGKRLPIRSPSQLRSSTQEAPAPGCSSPQPATLPCCWERAG